MSKAATAPATANEAIAPEGEAPAKSKKKLILIIALAVVLVGGGAGGFFFWKSRQGEHAKEAPKAKPLAPLLFAALDPPFVVNFQGAQAQRFLQIEVKIASRELETIELLKANDPVLRNDLLMMFGAQDATALANREGKEKLRTDALTQVRRIVKEAGGKPESVDTVLFTSFVMQ
jgi:flagellar FliL protein